MISYQVPRVLLRIPEAAEAIGVGRSTLYDLISRGVLPVVKLGKSRASGVRIRPQDLEEFARSNLKQPSGSAGSALREVL